ncbi:site-2 protease family protein [Virgibacillus halodenitrificans]|nr:site-2 protease family protein [Virgibacillus halodenitrificans]
MIRYFPRINIHPVLMIFIILSMLTGTFMELSIILAIVFFHELGHYIAAVIHDWRIKQIMLWVFGGVMDVEEHSTRPAKEEVIVTLAGPFQHVIIYLGLIVCNEFQLLPNSVLDLAYYYNTVILLFNLLPIWPLDGGKLLLQCQSLVFPFRKAYYSTLLVSMIISIIFLVIQLVFFPFTLSAFLLLLFLFMENRNEWKQRYYVFIRFLMSRYYNGPSKIGSNSIVVSHETMVLDVFSKFFRDRKHAIYVVFPGNRRKSIDENDCLHSFFHDKSYSKTVGEITDYMT